MRTEGYKTGLKILVVVVVIGIIIKIISAVAVDITATRLANIQKMEERKAATSQRTTYKEKDEKSDSAKTMAVTTANADSAQAQPATSMESAPVVKEPTKTLLSKLEPLCHGEYIVIGTKNKDISKDCLGNIYRSDSIFYPTSDWYHPGLSNTPNEAEYLIAYKYATISGTVYLPWYSREEDEPLYESKFEIYNAETDELLYSAPDIRKGAYDPVKFEVDISNTRIMKICLSGVWYRGDCTGANPIIAVADLTLTSKS